MCFPGKRLKNLFSDDDHPSTKPSVPSKEPSSQLPPAVASEPPAPESPPALPEVVTTSLETTMAPPKVAIIIYSLYGHIATGWLSCFSPVEPLLINYIFSVAESVKKGVEKAGGSAAIYQSVLAPPVSPKRYLTIITLELPKPCHPNYLPNCMLLLNLTTQSLLPPNSRSSTLSSWVFPPVMVTSPLNGRCVLPCSPFTTLIDHLAAHRPSGMPQANSGPVVPWPANTPLYSFPREPLEGDRVRILSHCLQTADQLILEITHRVDCYCHPLHLGPPRNYLRSFGLQCRFP